jgi:hypothetical protein
VATAPCWQAVIDGVGRDDRRWSSRCLGSVTVKLDVTGVAGGVSRGADHRRHANREQAAGGRDADDRRAASTTSAAVPRHTFTIAPEAVVASCWMGLGAVRIGAVVSTTPIGNEPDDSFPRDCQRRVHVALHAPSGTNVELPSAGRDALPDGPVRTQLTVAGPASSVADTVTLTLAPPWRYLRHSRAR